MKAQSSIVFLVLLLVVIGGLMLFLLSLASSVSQEDYMNMYVNNLLVSFMRTDLGYDDSNCRKVSDVIACAFLNPSWTCGSSTRSCLEVANTTISSYMDAFEIIRKNYRYLFTVRTKGGLDVWHGEETEPFRMEFGDPAVADTGVRRRTANYIIQSSGLGTVYNIEVRLMIAPR